MNLTEPAALELDRTICTIESLSRLLTTVTQAEEADIDPQWLADLGRVISQLAMTALDLAAEETITASDLRPAR